MIIGTIVNGIVIDHIPAGRGMELYKYLKLDDMECEVALIKNAVSDKLGKKDIVKICWATSLPRFLLTSSKTVRSAERSTPSCPKPSPVSSSARIPAASLPSNRNWSTYSS